MPDTVDIQSTAFQKVPHEAIGVIQTLGAVPVHGLTGMMLLRGHIAYVRHIGYGIREVVQGSRPDGIGLAGLAVLR